MAGNGFDENEPLVSFKVNDNIRYFAVFINNHAKPVQ